MLNFIYRAALAFCLVFLLFTMATAQEEIDVGERIYLRELTRAPAATKIVSAPKAKLPQKNPLRIFLALGLDFEMQSRFTRWLEEWNAKHGAKFGKVEIVSAAEQSDVILARFIDNDLTVTTTTQVPWSNGTVPIHRQKNYASAYSYLLLPAEGRLDVLWRGATQIDLDMSSRYSRHSGWELRDAMFTMLRKRS